MDKKRAELLVSTRIYRECLECGNMECIFASKLKNNKGHCENFIEQTENNV
jgi:hypothetical protein